MWIQGKPNHPSVILHAEYEDFASIEVEKLNSKNTSITHYMINIDIFDITEQSIDVYKMEDIERIMRTIRQEIENLYDDIPLYDENEIEKWIDDFCDLLTEIQ